MAQKFCAYCGQKLPVDARFCSECGEKLTSETLNSNKVAPQPISRKLALLFVSCTILVWALCWNVQAGLAGKRPEKVYQEQAGAQAVAEDKLISSLKAQLEKNPQDVDLRRSYASALFDKLRKQEQAPSSLVFETIDTLRAILQIEPEDKFALLAMADISFNQQVFEKAVQFFQKYLALEPSDVNALA